MIDKKQNNNVQPGWLRIICQKKGTNQQLISWPSNVYIHLPSNQSELRPQLMDQFVAPAQTQCLNQSRNLGKHEDSRQLNQNCPRSGLLKRIFSIPHYLWSPQDPLPLPLNFFLSHWIAFEIKQLPTWSFQTKTLISWKVLGPLVVPQDVYSMCHDRHIFLAIPAVKMTGFPGCVRWPSHREVSQLIRPIPSSPYTSASNVLFFGAHSLQFHRRCLFQMSGALHGTSSAPCAPQDPKRHLIL